MAKASATKAAKVDEYAERMKVARINPFVRFLCEIFFTLVFRLYLPTRIRGKQRLPKKGPFILVANHMSYLDPPLVGWAAWPLPLYVMAKEELWKNRLFGRLLSALGGFAVNRNLRDTSATRTALSLLKEEKALLMFPEGTRSESGELLQMRSGAIRLATKLQCPIVPAYLHGTERAMGRHAKFIRPARLTITFGPPFELHNLYDHTPTAAETEAAVAEMSRRIMRLQPPSRPPLR